tara:strand:+ start:6192 stop:6404 length:213 start_codon:yes stop_codon:yes gene_type:complete
MGLFIEIYKTQLQTSSPNVLKIKFALAGLLTYSTFSAFPSLILDSGIAVKKFFSELTATGTAPDLHRIPF